MPRRNPPINTDGETERLGSITSIHHFREAAGAVIPIRWHYVEAGDVQNESILFLHGNPETWYSWSPQIAHFGSSYRVIAPDLKGYGQSDKRPGDWRWENCAEELLALCDAIGVRRFNIVGHDRGCVLADYLAGNHPERVLRYVRMQQICHIWRSENSPQAAFYADPILGPALFRDADYWYAFRGSKMMTKGAVPSERIEKLLDEMSHPGAEAAVRYFQSSSFELEKLDRTSRLLRNMNFPVLLLQAERDDNQPHYYYDDPTNPAVRQFPNARLEWIEGAGHYTTLEVPEIINERIADFFHDTAREIQL